MAAWLEQRGPSHRFASDGSTHEASARWLWWPGVLGSLSLCAVAVGASLPDSPFKLNFPGTWFFGEPTPGATYSSGMYLASCVLVFAGFIVLMRTWIHLVRACTRRPGTKVRHLAPLLVAWCVPVLVVAPMLSRDIFSYAAQGELVARHLNPYINGPFTLGSNPFAAPVDPIWQNAPAPYGPLFLAIDGFFATSTGHHELATVVALRLLAVLGVVLIGVMVPKLARSYGRDPGLAFVLGAANPLVILALLGGSHNDAIMAGLLVAGMAAARSGHKVLGVVLCAAAAAIKAPAALGIAYIAWDWLGPGVAVKRRLVPIAVSGVLTAVVFVAASAWSGLGFGWISNLGSDGAVVSWTAPMTALGIWTAELVHDFGFSLHQTDAVLVARAIGLMAAGLIGVYLFSISERIGSLKACGLTLLVFVALGPVVQPWYFAWGLVLLAPIAIGRLRTALVVLSVVAPFIGIPGGKPILEGTFSAQPTTTAVILVLALVVCCAPLGPWTVPLGMPLERPREPALYGALLG